MPGVGDIPFIGSMFKKKDKYDEMDELLIFIAPRIL
jgi:type II secretory pathway component HofQ